MTRQRCRAAGLRGSLDAGHRYRITHFFIVSALAAATNGTNGTMGRFLHPMARAVDSCPASDPSPSDMMNCSWAQSCHMCLVVDYFVDWTSSSPTTHGPVHRQLREIDPSMVHGPWSMLSMVHGCNQGLLGTRLRHPPLATKLSSLCF